MGLDWGQVDGGILGFRDMNGTLRHKWPKLDAGRKAYREHLNHEYAGGQHKNYQGIHHFEQRSRPYGDYLWNQDRDMFEMNYAEWVEEQNHTQTDGGMDLQEDNIMNAPEVIKATTPDGQQLACSNCRFPLAYFASKQPDRYCVRCCKRIDREVWQQNHTKTGG